MASFIGTIISHRPVTNSVSEFAIKMAIPFSFQAGQYVTVTLPGLENESITNQFHDFSIASSTQNSKIITIVYRNSDSIFKTHLKNLPIGTSIEVEGPAGIFLYDATIQNQVWVAGGIGITPFLSMVCSGVSDNNKVELWYYARSQTDFIYLDEINRSSIVVHPVVGKVTTDTLHITNHPELIMIAGPPLMVDYTKQILVSQGHDKSQIITEEFAGYATKF